jgi:hypothetical protein
MVTASPSDILGAIADDRSSLLFDTIALSHSETSDVLLAKLKLTQKEYYSRMSKLVKANLVNRRQGKYFLTSLGKIVYDTQTTLRKAIADYWKLKAIDELESYDEEMPKEEYNKIINSLIDNEKIKEALRDKSHTRRAKSVDSLRSFLLLMIMHVSVLSAPVMSVCSSVSCLA